MNSLWPLLTLYLVNYFVGSIPFSFLIGKMYGKDIRQIGSGNVGATNVFRACGKVPGLLAYIADISKGILTSFFTLWYMTAFDLSPAQSEFNLYSLLLLLAFFIPILGHVFPVYLKFKGGKGVATSAGVLLVLLPIPTCLSILIFLIIFLFSKMVSISSIIASFLFPWLMWLQHEYGESLGVLGFQTSIQEKYQMILITITTFLAVFIISKHKANIHRLIQGQENTFKKK